MVWYVIYTAPAKERIVCDFLEKHGLITFCPMVRERKRYRVPGTRGQYKAKQVLVPSFPRYVFARADDRVHGVAHGASSREGRIVIIRSAIGPVPVRDEVVETLRDVKEFVRFDQIRPGSTVSLRALDGVKAEVVATGDDELRVRVKMLGGTREIRVSMNGVSEVVGPAG